MAQMLQVNFSLEHLDLGDTDQVRLSHIFNTNRNYFIYIK